LYDEPQVGTGGKGRLQGNSPDVSVRLKLQQYVGAVVISKGLDLK
jgi:hypothetical protein